MVPSAHFVIASQTVLYREALAVALGRFNDYPTTTVPMGLESVVEYLQQNRTDLVVLAGESATCDWRQLVASIIEAEPDTRILLIGSDLSDGFATSCVEAGASGYLPYTIAFTELKRALTRIMGGEVICSEKTTRYIFGRLSSLSNKRARLSEIKSVPLTARELEILYLISVGHTNQEVGGRLSISVHTVKNHVHKILLKLEVGTRLQAVHLAYKHNWIRVGSSRAVLAKMS